MDVFVRDVPEQINQNVLRTQLKPYMAALSIRTYHCQKHERKRFAFLTFLRVEEGDRFLQTYGQIKPSNTARAVSAKVQILGTPVYCAVSNKPSNDFVLKTLEKEENDLKTKRIPAHDTSKTGASKPASQRDFLCSHLSCGTWGYSGSELVYIPYFTYEENATAKFGSRSLVLMFDSGERVEFLYTSTYDITMHDGSKPSLTIALWEAPRIYDESPLANLSLSSGKQGQRLRVASLNPHHSAIVGSCFVYRIAVVRDTEATIGNHRLQSQMRALLKMSGLPTFVQHQVDSRRPQKSFSSGLNTLDQTLAATKSLPWKVKYQLRSLVSNGYLTPSQVLDMISQFQFLAGRNSLDVCIAALQKFRRQIPYPGTETDSRELELASLIILLKDAEEHAKSVDTRRAIQGTPQPTSDTMAMVHRVTVTPAGVYLYGPEAEPLNHVLRKYSKYHDYFIRVVFADEDGEQVRYNPRVSNEAIFNDRFKGILRNGISIAGLKFDFLGFSHSSLRSQSCWFMAPFVFEGSLLYDRILIQKLGDFTKIRCPAKCAARIGQAFSETPTAITYPSEIVKIIKDVKRNGRVFSDGVGTISRSVLRKIWQDIPSMRDQMPTCFQIRYRGAKGMISLDTRLKGHAVLLRPSMIKFEGSTSLDIEFCGAALRPLPMFLNRQLIKILEDMGVEDSWFLDLQTQEVENLRRITATAANAAKFLKAQTIGEVMHLSFLIKRLTAMGLEFRNDRFLRDVLELTVMMKVRVMKYRARIPVPLAKTLYGIMDETGVLEEGQIFCTFTDGNSKRMLIGKLIITRSPALHPGDVQFVDAVEPPRDSPLLSLSNCVCFSSKGDRDLPSKLSGGDLDGDLYNIIWDTGCSPVRSYVPADYPRQDPVDIGRKVERDDMTDFFIKFMETDQLGRIATTHQILADQKSTGTLDPSCILLAELHSTAVDFSKTGVPVDIKKIPRIVPIRPDFMAPGPNIKIEKMEGLLVESTTEAEEELRNDEEDFSPYRYYESKKALGKLYRAIDEHEIFADLHQYRINSSVPALMDQIWTYVSRKCQLVQWQQHLQEAEEIRDVYEEAILTIMKNYSEHPLRPMSELEAFIGDILGAQGSQSRKQRDLSIPMKEAFNSDVSYVIRCIIGSNDEDSEERLAEALERSIACFYVSLGEVTRVNMGGRRTESLISFRYLAAAVCLKEMDRASPS